MPRVHSFGHETSREITVQSTTGAVYIPAKSCDYVPAIRLATYDFQRGDTVV